MEQSNPFASRSVLEYELPDFTQIRDEHYLPAFYEGCASQLAEVEAILAQPKVSFENTLVALEKSGAMLHRMLVVFYNKSSADTNDTINAIESEIAPKLAAHNDAIKLNPITGISFTPGLHSVSSSASSSRHTTKGFQSWKLTLTRMLLPKRIGLVLWLKM